MRSILAGVETEYGLLVGDRGAAEQVGDAMELVRGYPGLHFAGWNYRYESPRADLRGFRLERLAYDPVDAKFDQGRSHGKDPDIRSDRVLPNGARFYNDHGHPEYSTPECLSIHELAAHDRAGQRVVHSACRAFSEQSGHEVWAYKNNTDFHGASYGTHENYLVPRSVGFERLFQDVTPLLIARMILVGAGKVGSESGPSCAYQISQRADFYVESANAETLYRRPIFNTRDEPHADPARYIRMHVICGDANMIPEATARKIGLVKLALALCEANCAPLWRIANPVRTAQAISRDASYKFEVGLEGRSWTTADEILESYFSAAERLIELDQDLRWVIDSSRELLSKLRSDFPAFARKADWAAKKRILENYIQEEGSDWNDPALRAYDLEYHNVDPESSLHAALEQMNEVEQGPSLAALVDRLLGVQEPTRARARGLAVLKFREHLVDACWRSLTFELNGETVEVELPPEAEYHAQLEHAADVGTFVTMLRGVSCPTATD
jgi:hypothetical protein